MASDRASIFDFVLPDCIQNKGHYLTALSHFNDKLLRQHGFMTDFMAAGADVDDYLPEALRGVPDIQKRGTIVHILPSPDVEDIVRFALTGTGWSSYVSGGRVCGHVLPAGLTQGALLDTPIYTPTTKSQDDHDELLDVTRVREAYPRREEVALRASQIIHDFAQTRGMMLVDIKWELTLYKGLWYVVDEKATPDSSRYWDREEWIAALVNRDTLPPSYDKQNLRNWGIKAGIERRTSDEKRSPKNAEDLEFVDNAVVPNWVVQETIDRYDTLFYRITGMNLVEYQREVMKIRC